MDHKDTMDPWPCAYETQINEIILLDLCKILKKKKKEFTTASASFPCENNEMVKL